MRKAAAKKRYLAPDPKYKDPLVTRFVNDMMNKGKKSTSFGIFSFFNHLHGVAVQPQTLICSYFKSQQSHLVAFSNNFTFIKSIEGDILS